MNWRVIGALVAKDVTLYFKNRFFALITVLALVAYAVLFYLMPGSVAEVLEIGLYAPTLPEALIERFAADGIAFRAAPSEEALKAAVAQGDQVVGVVLSPELLGRLVRGEQGRIDVYFGGAFPEDFRGIYTTVLQELAFTLSGRPLPVEISEQVLGPDMVGRQVPPRERMLPLLAIFVLMMETMGLASLISAEVEEGTLQALLVTPLGIGELFVGKGVTGVGLAFGQAVLLVAVTGGLSRQPLLVLAALLLGALMVTGVAFLLASVSKDMMSVLSWGVLALLVLMIPTMGILFPGTVSDWVRVIPSHYLVDTVFRVVNLRAGWGAVGVNLAALLAFSVAFFWLGGAALRRRFA